MQFCEIPFINVVPIISFVNITRSNKLFNLKYFIATENKNMI